MALVSSPADGGRRPRSNPLYDELEYGELAPSDRRAQKSSLETLADEDDGSFTLPSGKKVTPEQVRLCQVMLVQVSLGEEGPGTKRKTQTLPLLVFDTDTGRSIKGVDASEDGEVIGVSITNGEYVFFQGECNNCAVRESTRHSSLNGSTLLPEVSGMATIGRDGNLVVEIFSNTDLRRLNATVTTAIPGEASGEKILHASADGKWLSVNHGLRAGSELYLISLHHLTEVWAGLPESELQIRRDRRRLTLNPIPFPVTDGGSRITATAMSPTKETAILVGAGWNGAVRAFNLNQLKSAPYDLREASTREDPAYEMAFSPDGKYLAVGTRKGNLLAWKVGQLKGGKTKIHPFERGQPHGKDDV